jgi:hypothetical protein
MQRERMHLEEYRLLAVSKEQARAMSHVWAHIKSRRNALNAQYASIAADIAAIPSAACVPDALALTIAELCQPHRAGHRAAISSQETRCTGEGVRAVQGPGLHEWARHVLGSSAAATAAAGAALERLWGTLVIESDSQNTVSGLSYTCLSPGQVARFKSAMLTQSRTFEADMFRMCQLAAQKVRRDHIFELQSLCSQVL